MIYISIDLPAPTVELNVITLNSYARDTKRSEINQFPHQRVNSTLLQGHTPFLLTFLVLGFTNIPLTQCVANINQLVQCATNH